jgi:hypothetical protein
MTQFNRIIELREFVPQNKLYPKCNCYYYGWDHCGANETKYDFKEPQHNNILRTDYWDII